ncbi:o-succinylbenzoate synthase [Cellulomonas taurus]|uniref:o-succinylbenzoate synthase n=1 Tax=Cellulomonas taurus TaxID=2729175 RepID=UPI00145E603D|nr:o-succinylbenzoate synthase [Cellulomonas taurus]
MVHVYAIGLRTRFRRITVREGVLIEGPAGWGEFSPFWDYDAAESAAWWRATREATEQGLPEPVRDRVPVNVTVPAVDAALAARIVRDSGGCRTAKVKVAEPGQTAAQEADRLAAVREALGPEGAIRVDANGGWDVDTAIDRLRLLDRAAGGLEYAEQPVATVPDLARVRRAVQVPIAADESIRRAEDPFAVVRAEAADIVVLKVQPIGGVRACLDLAEQIGLPVVVSSAIESSVGLAAGVALAAALPELPYACGLATAQLLTDDVTAHPLLPVDGALDVAAARSLRPEPERLAAVAADPETAARWRHRVDQVLAVAG